MRLKPISTTIDEKLDMSYISTEKIMTIPLRLINRKMASICSMTKQEEAQVMYPHYFERYQNGWS